MAGLKDLSAGKEAPQEVRAVIEIAQGSNIKYEVDAETGILTVDRFLHTAMNYPFNYGFIPGTLAADGDPLDVLVLSRYPVQPGSVMMVKPIGVLLMEDEGGEDEKIVAVPRAKVDPFYGVFEEVEELPAVLREQIRHFFEHYKDLEKGKWVKVGQWQDAAAARKMVEKYLQS